MMYALTYVVAVALTGIVSIPASYGSETPTSFPNPLGTLPKSSSSGRLVKITVYTKYVNAEHFETVIIENHRGQRFSWQFDTQYAPTGFPLRRIASPGFESGSTWVYVDHPPRHVATD